MTPTFKYAATFVVATCFAYLVKYYKLDLQAIDQMTPLASGVVGVFLLSRHRPGSPNAGLEPKQPTP